LIINYGGDKALIRWLGLFMGIILLTIFLATAQEDYAMVISGRDDGRIEAECPGCFANALTQSDTQAIESVRMGLAEVGVGNVGLTAPIVIENLNLRNLPGNGIMIANTDAPIVLKDITVESLGVRDQSSLPVGIGMQNAKNVLIENCTALNGALFRIANSQNIQVRNNRARNFYLEGVNNSTIENCTSDCITIKGGLSPYFYKLFGPSHDINNETFLGVPNTMVRSQCCVVKDCNRVKEIDMFDAEDCNVENCSVENVGLWMMNANNVTIRNSTVTNATLSMDWSKKIGFENVSLINSDISLGGSVPEDYAISFQNSTVDGKPIYYYENQRELKLENLSAGQIWLVNCSRSVVNNVNANGIFVVSSDGVAIRNSQVEGNGVNLAFSDDCVISNNRLTDKKSRDGILQYAVCKNVTTISNILI
jgi:hypothetical protein